MANCVLCDHKYVCSYRDMCEEKDTDCLNFYGWHEYEKEKPEKGFYCVITDRMLDDDASFFNTDYFRGKTCWMKYGANHVKYWREAFTLPEGVKISRSYGRVYDKK